MKAIQRTKTCNTLLAFAMLSIALAPAFSGTVDAQRTMLGRQIRQHCAERKISGGILVYLGDPDHDLLRDLAGMSRNSFLVRGLLPATSDLDARRKRLIADGFYGNVSLVHRTGSELPFIPNLVNVLFVDSPARIAREEILGGYPRRKGREPFLGCPCRRRRSPEKNPSTQLPGMGRYGRSKWKNIYERG